MSQVKIKSALISVFSKDNLAPIIELLKANGVTIYSTGGTQKFIEEQGAEVVPVEDLTSYPSIFGGRVKTLHPKVFGGILHRRDNEGDLGQAKEFEIPSIDLVIVDLYPFEETVASGAAEQDIIEKIDIGGISLIRAAAKNFKDVLIVS
ncbi:MAG: bifunctional phosphoribosylaminoimidazolecarboxamide formyltransferase/IMP cyclohydrolase PurH, partial [Cytophagia bacterium]|nr:bifunctional phosphoribosylaminoimidazolecarboxamide formyltransferase/IMP cyclohydrolase PurH [Cytophagia bacterium]